METQLLNRPPARPQPTLATDPTVVLALGDDWEGLYVDGELVAEGHQIDAAQAIQGLGYAVETVTCCGEWLSAQGTLPPLLSEVVPYVGLDD